jgi:hypothetical protein
MTFADLRALHSIIGNAIDTIDQVFKEQADVRKGNDLVCSERFEGPTLSKVSHAGSAV